MVAHGRLSISAPAVGGFASVVDTGIDALDLSTLKVVAVTDDHPMGIVSVTVSPRTCC